MDPSLQVKLLRLIQSGTFQKIGGSNTETVDIRFVCATNKDPWHEVQCGNFREDLYYRLHVIPIHLPPLRDRDADVLELAEHFLKKYASDEGKSFNRIADDARLEISGHNWPGNVRQLQNAIRNVIVLNEGDVLLAEMLPELVGQLGSPQSAGSTVATGNAQNGEQAGSYTASLTSVPDLTIRPMWQVEREMIEMAMKQLGDNVHKVAATLEMSPSTVYRRLREIEDDLAGE